MQGRWFRAVGRLLVGVAVSCFCVVLLVDNSGPAIDQVRTGQIESAGGSPTASASSAATERVRADTVAIDSEVSRAQWTVTVCGEGGESPRGSVLVVLVSGERRELALNEGAFNIDIRETLKCLVRAEGFVAAEVTPLADAGRRLEVMLPYGLHGSILLRDSDGSPVAGSCLVLEAHGPTNERVYDGWVVSLMSRYQGETDNDGVCMLSGVRHGTYHVSTPERGLWRAGRSVMEVRRDGFAFEFNVVNAPPDAIGVGRIRPARMPNAVVECGVVHGYVAKTLSGRTLPLVEVGGWYLVVGEGVTGEVMDIVMVKDKRYDMFGGNQSLPWRLTIGAVCEWDVAW